MIDDGQYMRYAPQIPFFEDNDETANIGKKILWENWKNKNSFVDKIKK